MAAKDRVLARAGARGLADGVVLIPQVAEDRRLRQGACQTFRVEPIMRLIPEALRQERLFAEESGSASTAQERHILIDESDDARISTRR